jgi:hypothetical protein
MNELQLTPQEEAELAARPIGNPEWRNLTEEQISVRVEIGKKMQAHILSVDHTIPERFRSIYEKAPLWGFYEAAETGWPPRRAFGVCIGAGGEDRLHTVTLMASFNNRTIGGTPISSLHRVERWSPGVIEQMKCGLYRDTGLWEDPLGFCTLIREAADD